MDFDPFAYDWEDDSISQQIPPSETTEESFKSPVPEDDPTAEQNSPPESPKEDPKSSIPENVPATIKKVPAAPKRKRNDVDDTKDRGTTPSARVRSGKSPLSTRSTTLHRGRMMATPTNVPQSNAPILFRRSQHRRPL
jgi:hypothetical protein